MCAYCKELPKISINTILPKNTKEYLYAYWLALSPKYESFISRLKSRGLQESNFLEDEQTLDELQILNHNGDNIYYDEASYVLTQFYLEKEYYILNRISFFFGRFV